jgi:uncharacterized protein YcbK (DUF882 family)
MGDISAHFSRNEFACHCGCGYDTVDALLLEALEAIRVRYGVVFITSAARCPAHNASVGGAEGSQHKLGRAADITLSSAPPAEIASFAEDLGMSVGRYDNFTHVDSRTGVPARWNNTT